MAIQSTLASHLNHLQSVAERDLTQYQPFDAAECAKYNENLTACVTQEGS